VVAAFVVLVWAADFRFRDPDSKLYSALGQALGQGPFSAWIAPEWGGHWGRSGLFREHPPLLLWVTASLVRGGAPPEQAAGIANILYYLLTFFFVYRLGVSFGGSAGLGWTMALATLLTPVTLLYVIRGNLEPPLTAAMIGGMYAFLRSDRSWVGRIGFAAALVAATFFKGMQGAIVAIVAGIYWVLWARDRARLLTLMAGVVVTFGACILFEWAYRGYTGQAFWLPYMQIQLGYSLMPQHPWDKLYNLLWYAGRAIFFALPWAAVLLAWRWLPPREVKAATDQPLWRWLMLSAMVLILIMSWFGRRADRYIFPAYTLLAMAGAWLVWAHWPGLRRLLERYDAILPHLFGATLLAVAVGKVLGAQHWYRHIQFWRY
jgi:hypothetical protein